MTEGRGRIALVSALRLGATIDYARQAQLRAAALGRAPGQPGAKAARAASVPT